MSEDQMSLPNGVVGVVNWPGRGPVEIQLAAIEMRQAEIERKLDNLTEYVRLLMTNDQKLRCTPPEK